MLRFSTSESGGEHFFGLIRRVYENISSFQSPSWAVKTYHTTPLISWGFFILAKAHIQNRYAQSSSIDPY